jgi:hypothetical protein
MTQFAIYAPPGLGVEYRAQIEAESPKRARIRYFNGSGWQVVWVAKTSLRPDALEDL